MIAVARRAAVAVALLVALVCAVVTSADAAPWLFVSDVHLNPLSKVATPSTHGFDTNEALLRSALAAMRRADPAPPVVVIAGDFLGHNFESRYAVTTMAHVAHAFGRAFPQAQFVIALGNEDSACGDYVLARNEPYLRETAAIWAPLVNRRGAAPEFVRTFSRDGFYTTKLPIPGLRAVALDDVFWAPRHRTACGSNAIDGAAEELRDLDRAVPHGAKNTTWLLLHLPPGIDAFSTIHLAHHLAVVPFLDPSPRGRLLAMIGQRDRNVRLVIAGHTHKFSFRLLSGGDSHETPLLVVPALSPIFGNNPMFLTADVGRDGKIETIDVHAYDGAIWHDIGGTKTLGASAFSGTALASLRTRLDDDPKLQADFARLYDGGAPSEITPANWPGYSCAIVTMDSTAYRHCLGERGYRFLTLRGIALAAAIAAAALIAAIGGAVYLMRRSAR